MCPDVNNDGLTSLVSWVSHANNADTRPYQSVSRRSRWQTKYLRGYESKLLIAKSCSVAVFFFYSQISVTLCVMLQETCGTLSVNSILLDWFTSYCWSLYALELPCEISLETSVQRTKLHYSNSTHKFSIFQQ